MWLKYCWGDNIKFLSYVSPSCFKNTFKRDSSLFLLEDKQNSKSEVLINHGFNPFLAMVYRCFEIHYSCFGVFLVCFQVLEWFGGKWWFRCIWTENDKGPKLTIDHDYRSMDEGNNRSTHTLWCRSMAKRKEARLGSSRLKSQVPQVLQDYTWRVLT